MRRIGYAAFVLAFLVDIATKQWVLSYFAHGPARPVEILPILNLTLLFNKGVSFGWLSGGGMVGKYALTAFGIIAAIVLIWMINKATNRWQILGYGMIAGGALGNSIDRLRHGGVVDFLDVKLGAWHFWTFNFADAAITIGVICLLIDMIVRDKTED